MLERLRSHASQARGSPSRTSQGQRAHATGCAGRLEITTPSTTHSLRQQQDTTKMPWSPQPQIMARTKASHIRLPAEPAEHRVVAGTLTNRRRMGQEARRLERTFGPSRFNHLRRPATPPPEWHIDGEGTPPPVRYGRPRRAKRAPAPAPAAVPTGDSGHLVLPDDCVWPPPDSFREKAQTGGRPRPRADKFVAKSIVRNNGGALRHVEPELKGDRDVVLAAVRNSGRALEHASPARETTPPSSRWP